MRWHAFTNYRPGSAWQLAIMVFAGTEYTLSLYMNAAPGPYVGGSTNGHIDVMCMPSCAFPVSGYDYKDDNYPVLASGAPVGGLTGNGPWNQLALSFTPTVNCPAIMFGPSRAQTFDPQSQELGLIGSYVLFDALNLQETSTADGQCDANNQCAQL